MSNYKDFWIDAKKKVRLFEKLDDADMVFGANTRGWGHKYKIYPVMVEQEILTIEKEKNISLPEEFRFYLSFFGTGGAGPDYGVENFRETFKKTEFEKPFVYTELSKQTGDICDNEPIEDFEGLIYVGTAGCGSDYYLELLGENIGMVWCNWGDGGCNGEGNFCDFYSKWLEKVELGLKRYQKLKEIEKRFSSLFGKFRSITFQDIVNHMECEYRERAYDGNQYGVPKGLTWVYFDRTPGKIILNDKREVMRIDFSDRCSI